ncbi:hypothetical protein AVEN_192012-1 [Araneus ventricosus]|uniref:Uncharacterized protein n=1 Tax=Araneus ventricosus TaxID=182803 RepID=A0A4Y2B968_ARAVE|nr:hypothetical protein AVEN_192012-1 [Araneus ventricosus]
MLKYAILFEETKKERERYLATTRSYPSLQSSIRRHPHSAEIVVPVSVTLPFLEVYDNGDEVCDNSDADFVTEAACVRRGFDPVSAFSQLDQLLPIGSLS